MTDNTIPLPEAIRAYKDRPSMERELSALRAKCERLEAAIGGIAEYDRPENNFTIHPNWRDAFFELVKIAKRTLEK